MDRRAIAELEQREARIAELERQLDVAHAALSEARGHSDTWPQQSPATERSGAPCATAETSFCELAEHLAEVFWLGSVSWDEVFYVSPPFEKVWGRPTAELLNSPWCWFESIVAEDAPSVREALRHFSTDDPKPVALPEFRIRRPDGSLRWIVARVLPVFDAPPSATRLAVIAEDVTQKRRTETALRESESNLRRAQEVGNIGSWVYDIVHEHLTWSEQTRRIFAVDDQFEPSYEAFLSAVHPDDREHVASAWEAALAGEAYDVEHRILAGDQVRWVHQRVEIEFDANQVPLRGVGTCQDVTQRREADDRRSRAEALLLAAIEQTPVGIAIAEAPDGNLRLVNRAGLGTRGQSADKLTGIAFEDYSDAWQSCRPDGSPFPAAEYPLARAIREGTTVENEEILIRHTSGENRWVMVSATPVRDDHSKIIAAVAVFPDITERRRVEEEIRRLNSELERRVDDRTAQLEAVNRDLKEFAYVVSHDLKAPLRAIAQLSQWIKQDHGDSIGDAGREQIDLMIQRVGRMYALIDGVLAYSRVGRIEERHEPVNLSWLLGDIVESLAPPDHYRVELPESLPVITAEPTRVRQVFQNLIGNALKYIDKPVGIVTIDYEDCEEAWRFLVSDNGPGIDPRFHRRIFGIFQKLDGGPDEDGTGIGLALVKKIVEQCGGTVGVRSEPGMGSTFWFTWPKSLRETS